MFSKQASIPPVFIAIVVWGVQVGVAAGGWTLSPILSWGLFAALLIAIFWFAVVWVYNGIEWLGKYTCISNVIKWSVVIVLSLVPPAVLFAGVKLPPLITPDCGPKVAWQSRVDIGHDENIDAPYLIHYAVLTPYGPDPYWMEIKGDFGDLKGLAVFTLGPKEERGSEPWQGLPTGIHARIFNPRGLIGIYVVATNLSEVRLDDPIFECANGAR